MPKQGDDTELLRLELATSGNDRGRQLQAPPRGALIALNHSFAGLYPYKVKRPNGGRYQRFARLGWLSFAMATEIASSKDLTAGEVWRILNWLNGTNPATGELPRGQDQEQNIERREAAITLWMVRHHEQIMDKVTRAKELMIAKQSGGKSSDKSSPSTASTSSTTANATPEGETNDG